MSSNGTRKETRGWEISSSGQMVNISTDDVGIEEMPPSGPIVVNAGGTPPPVPHAPPKKRNDVTTDAMAMLNRPPRERKSTLDTFNDEMSVLDRPIEGDVEYADEAPRPSRMRGVALFAGIVLGMGLARRRDPLAPACSPAGERAGSANRGAGTGDGGGTARRAGAAPTVLAAQVAPTPAPGAPPAEAATAPAAEDDDAANEDAAPAPAPGSHAAWDKVKAKTAHGKASRAASGKSSHHHSSKRAASTKHASSRHH